MIDRRVLLSARGLAVIGMLIASPSNATPSHEDRARRTLDALMTAAEIVGCYPASIDDAARLLDEGRKRGIGGPLDLDGMALRVVDGRIALRLTVAEGGCVRRENDYVVEAPVSDLRACRPSDLQSTR